MNETTEQIETHIRQTREDLSANLNELEQKVKTAADWRHHYAKSPGTFLAAAVGGGLLLALATSSGRSRGAPSSMPPSHPVSSRPKEKGRLDGSITVIKDALIGLAANQAKSLLSQLLPGFEGQLPEDEKLKPHPSSDTGRRSAPGSSPRPNHG
jgi:hypothetical protein